MTKERMLYIDRLKALAMIMVVMGHTIYFFIRFINLDFLIGKNIMIELMSITLLTVVIVYCSIGVGKVTKLVRTMEIKK